MTVAIRCATPIQGSIIRVTSLNSCGVPITGTSDADASPGQIVMDGFTQVSQSFVYEEGERKFVRKANGQPCVNFQGEEDALVEVEVTIDLCLWNPGLVVAAINACLLNYSESPTGTGFGVLEGIGGKHFALDLWTPLAGDAGCDSSGAQLYAINTWAHMWNGKLGDITQGADPHTLQIIAKTKKPNPLFTQSNTWLGSGALTNCQGHWLWNQTATAPPASACVIADVA